MSNLVVFVKVPRVGQVKTRLARDIGPIDALWWYRHQTARLIRRLDRDPRWRLVLAVSPGRALRARDWPAHIPRIAQGEGDLGRRMRQALHRFRSPTLVVGSDIPGLGRGHISAAFRLLGRFDIVVGPATDGGFWGIGRAAGVRLPPLAMRGIEWSTDAARHQTERSLAPLDIGHAALLQDVDTAADLRPRQGSRPVG